MPQNIQHLVVLMMENRSFDHMLGFLKSPAWPIDGLDGTETNPNMQGSPVLVSSDAPYAGTLQPDPGHDFVSVNEQVFNNSTGTGTANMQGFVRNYHGKTNNASRARNVMKCFGPGRLPALSTLAREYAVCDRWFSSVPGPTLPNRAFALGATSLGRVDMNPNYLTLKTIFERLDEHEVPARIYYTDWTVGLSVGYILQRSNRFLFFFDDFIRDCRQNRLPALSYVDPRFNDFSDRGSFFPAADQHPDHNVFQGEIVIKAVYDAITSNRQTWESTLLVITYDEHGGLYDHVVPPATVNPDGRNSATPPFSFDRLGVRVPAVLVSPFIPPGTILSETFDHASLVATARKLFLPGVPDSHLTERDRLANTFETVASLDAPRPGRVTIPQPTSGGGAGKKGASKKSGARRAGAARAAGSAFAAAPAPSGPSLRPINEFQAVMVQHAFAFDASLPADRQTDTLVSALRTEQDTAQYLAEVRARIEAERNGGRKPPRPGAKKAGVKKGGRKKSAAKKGGAKKTGAKKGGRKRASKSGKSPGA